jgi:hypothetical protein
LAGFGWFFDRSSAIGQEPWPIADLRVPICSGHIKWRSLAQFFWGVRLRHDERRKSL